MSYIYYTENIGAVFNTIYVLSVHFHCPKDKNNYKTYISDKYDKFSLFLHSPSPFNPNKDWMTRLIRELKPRRGLPCRRSQIQSHQKYSPKWLTFILNNT